MTIEKEEGDICDQEGTIGSVLLVCNKFVFFNMRGNYN
jgi:hypothetical protein